MHSNKSTSREALCHRLSVTGIPSHLVPQIVDLFEKWCNHNGPEWAVKRFKSLKVDLIRQNTGQTLLTQYVRKNRHGEFAFALGALFRWARKSSRNFARAIQALCIYTSQTSKTVTKSQLKKFIGAVTCDSPCNLTLELLSRISWTAISVIGHQDIKRCDNSVVTYRGSPEKFAPVPHSKRTVPQNREIMSDIRWLDLPSNYSFTWKHYALYAPVLAGSGYPTVFPKLESMDSISYAGEVHFIQEPGYKLRAVASPYRIHQLALKPLGDSIGDIVRCLPWDCTFDQSKAIPIIQRNLKSGNTVYSIDLSNATDYFPLDIQLMVLRTIFGDVPDLQLFHDLSRMAWKSENGDITWKRGQPLGMYPSFFAFTLSHGLVLETLSNEDSQFLVVGDDVVIFDTDLYNQYIKFLNDTGCPYSVEKSITSSQLAEFAGKVITPDLAIPQLKWRKMSNDSFLDLARLIGPRSRELMTRRQQEVFDAVKHLQEPVGLNMSIPGKDLSFSLLETEKFLLKVQQRVVRSLTGLTRTVWNNSMDDPSKRVLDPDTRTFDEKVLMVFQQTVFKHWMCLHQIADLPQALGLYPRLPIESSPKRVSTLLRYEGILRPQS
jgi:hypothetical protein